MMKQVITEEGFPNSQISGNTPTTDINIFKDHFRQMEITFTDEQSGYFGTLRIFSRKIGDFLGKLKELATLNLINFPILQISPKRSQCFPIDFNFSSFARRHYVRVHNTNSAAAGRP